MSKYLSSLLKKIFDKIFAYAARIWGVERNTYAAPHCFLIFPLVPNPVKIGPVVAYYAEFGFLGIIETEDMPAQVF